MDIARPSFLAGTIMLTMGFDFMRYLADHSSLGDLVIDHEIKIRKYTQHARIPILIANMIPSDTKIIN
ncbi:MAG TPA: hypothetical protein VFR61_00105 [Nitrososphaeraceae archaeon]|nr:hypothetical protein [Nitrososphaeraceae archaeon]